MINLEDSLLVTWVYHLTKSSLAEPRDRFCSQMERLFT